MAQGLLVRIQGSTAAWGVTERLLAMRAILYRLRITTSIPKHKALSVGS